MHPQLRGARLQVGISPRTRFRVNMAEPNDYAEDIADTGPERDGGAASASLADSSVEGSVDRQLADQRDRYLRLAAEYDNYRKRTAKERQEASQRGQADLLKGLIDSIDDIARFAHVDPSTVDAKTVVDGVAMVEKKVFKSLGALGLEVLDPAGDTFDPALHEAVMTEPAAAQEDDHVVSRVFQLGYVFNGQLLRPARVVVKQWNG